MTTAGPPRACGGPRACATPPRRGGSQPPLSLVFTRPWSWAPAAQPPRFSRRGGWGQRAPGFVASHVMLAACSRLARCTPVSQNIIMLRGPPARLLDFGKASGISDFPQACTAWPEACSCSTAPGTRRSNNYTSSEILPVGTRATNETSQMQQAHGEVPQQ